MKPYFRLVYNKVKFGYIKIFKCKKIKITNYVLFNYNTKILVHKSSNVTLGKNIISDGRCVINVDQNAELYIGNKVYFNEDAMISVKSNVYIGSNCRFGPNVKIFDNNHCFNKETGVSDMHKSANIYIGDNCWIAANAIILKGSHIGENSVIGAGCIIKGNIPKSSIVTMQSKLKITPIEDR